MLSDIHGDVHPTLIFTFTLPPILPSTQHPRSQDKVRAEGCKQLSLPHGIWSPGTHCCWVARGNVHTKACPGLSCMAGDGDRTHDLMLIGLPP